MSLVTGLYTIRSAIPSTPFVGRSPFEDHSLDPKKILSLPTDEQDLGVVQVERSCL
jgi:Peptidase inhibitor I66